MINRFIFLLFFFCSFQIANAQIDVNETPLLDTIPDLVDAVETKKEKKKFFLKGILKEPYPSPRKAALLSMMLPGAGQAYNKKYWKIPFVYAGIGGLIYAVHWNGTAFRSFRKAHKASVDDLDCTVYQGNLDATSLKNLRDFHEKNYQLSIIGLGVVYLLNGVEAYVNAHLLTFDVDDDLSLLIQPQSQILPNGNTALGVGLSLQFKQDDFTIHPAFSGF